MKKILILLVTIPLICLFIGKISNLNLQTVSASEEPVKLEFDEQNIVLRFGALSDVHIGFQGNEAIVNRAIASLDKLTGSKMDALVFAGDITQNGRKEEALKFKEIVENHYDLSTFKTIVALGNHDVQWDGCMTKEEFAETWGEDFYQLDEDKTIVSQGNRHIVVNNYHFLVLNVDHYDRNVFSTSTKVWLKGMLDELTTKNPLDPVFVVCHSPANDTVIGSEKTPTGEWGSPELEGMLGDYSQVVLLSGHLHYPENDERFINQTTYTQVSVGSATQLSTEKGYLENAGGAVPKDRTYSQGLYFEVDKDNNIRITRYDLLQNRMIKDYTIIPAVKEDGSHLIPYNKDYRMKNNINPTFSNQVEVKVQKEGTNNTLLQFTRATDDDMVYAYQVEIVNKDGVTVKTFKTFEDWRDYPDLSEMVGYHEVLLSGFVLPKPYTVKITAIDSWGATSETQVVEIPDTSKEDMAIAQTVIEKITLLEEIDAIKNKQKLTKTEIETINSVRSKYNELNNDQKFYVTNLAKLLEAETLIDNYYASKDNLDHLVNIDDYFKSTYDERISLNSTNLGVNVSYNNGVSNAITELSNTYDLHNLTMTFSNLEMRSGSECNFCILISTAPSPRYGENKSLLLWCDLISGKIKVFPHDGGTTVIENDALTIDKLGKTRFSFTFSEKETGAYLLKVKTTSGTYEGEIPTANLTTIENFDSNARKKCYISFSSWNDSQNFSFNFESIGNNLAINENIYLADSYLIAKQMNKIINNLPTVDSVKITDLEQVELAQMAYGLLDEDTLKYVENEEKINLLKEKIELLIAEENKPTPTKKGCSCKKGIILPFISTMRLASLCLIQRRKREW